MAWRSWQPVCGAARAEINTSGARRRALVGRGQIIDDLANVRIVDRRAIDLDHFRDFGLPEVVLEFRPARLSADVVRRVTGGAIVLYHFKVWSGLECRGFVGKRVGDRSRACRATPTCGGGRCEEKREEKTTGHDLPPHAAVTRTVSITLRKYPAGFQNGSAGCVSPALLVARTLSSKLPAASLTGSFHSRNVYFPRSLPSFAGIQVLPPSSETATSLIPLPPSNAIPFSVVPPGFSFAPSVTLVMKERTVKRLIGLVASAWGVRNPIGRLHPEAVEHAVDDSDFVEVFQPVGAVIARHDEAKRKAVENRQLLAVHAVGQHHLAIAGVVDIERLDEIRRLVADRSVHPVEGDLLCPLPHAGLVEHGFERHAAPARIAHRAVGQLTAGHAWIGKAAAVARALIDGDELDRGKLPYFLQRQLDWAVDFALDLQRELIRIDVERHIRQMIADEKSVVRRNRAVIENRKWRLELRRPAGQADHRALLGIFHQRPFAVVDGQGHGVERERPE